MGVRPRPQWFPQAEKDNCLSATETLSIITLSTVLEFV